MQISIDIRWYDKKSPYGRYVIELISQIIKDSNENTYIIYSNIPLEIHVWENANLATLIITKKRKENLWEQFTFLKTLKKDHSHFYIFFDEKVPFWFKKDFALVIPSLKEIFFPKLWFIERLFYQKYMHYSLKNAEKVICFEKNTAQELNERLNVKENKIHVVHPFFSLEQEKISTDEIKINIKTKYNILGDYILYDAKNDGNSNFERILKIFQKLIHWWEKINLLVISENATQNISFRQRVLDLEIEKSVFFIGTIEEKEESFYYSQSSWVIFPWIYTSFPFEFTKAILYKIPIIATKIDSTYEIMWDNIIYFNSRSISEATKQIIDFIKNKKKISYTTLNRKLTIKETAKNFKKVLFNNEK